MNDFRIWFQPHEGAGCFVDHPHASYSTHDEAERQREVFARADNPAWVGVFTVVRRGYERADC